MPAKRIDVFNDKLVGVSDLVRLFGCHRRTVYARIKAGALPPPVKVGGKLQWAEADVLAVLEKPKRRTTR